ncbi:MAG: GGDEF domain-containing protein, partial [Anaerolineales bacterium]
YLKESLQREFNRANRELFPISILIMDIDNFKNINDTYGHQVGDKFLIKIADLLKKNSRGSDITCRYGGEEFILVLPETEAQIAHARAEQFRAEISQVRIPHEMKDLNISVSMGIAVYPEHSTIAEELIVKADLALYQSKNNGRNRVTVWRETMQKDKV